MKFTRSAEMLAALVVGLVLGLAGCASQKEPAEQAVAAIEKSLEGSGAMLQKYVPERYEEISVSFAALREKLAKEDYGDVVAGAPAVVDALRKAVGESQIQKAKAQVEMETAWETLVKTMPAMLAEVDKEISSQGGRPPKGMDRDAYKALVATYDAARASWSKAAESIDAANFESTVATAREARTAIAGVMDSLGMKGS
ncbi:MAG: hypothetical protein HW392_1367 [Steroidobacteraceae bacterium]|nr:hypothetical protein [Steroidobacteraceae bacterium]